MQEPTSHPQGAELRRTPLPWQPPPWRPGAPAQVLPTPTPCAFFVLMFILVRLKSACKCFFRDGDAMKGEEAKTRGSPSGKDGGFLRSWTGPSDACIAR